VSGRRESRPEALRAPGAAADEAAWERLDRRAVARAVLGALGVPAISALPAALALADRGAGVLVTALIAAALFAVVLVAIGVYEALRRATTWFRVTGERVELRTELIAHRRRSLRRDRIRTVDVSAGPTHRLLGLAKLEIGTAQDAGSGGDRLTLDPIARERAEALRLLLLDRAPRPGAAAAPAPAVAPSVTLARLDLRWIRYAPLSFATFALATAAAGALWQGAQWVGLDDDLTGSATDAIHAWKLVVLVVVALALVGAIGTLAVFAEQWFGYRLERERDGTLGLRRGLLTARSLTLEERRLRGVELVEPLALRPAGAARVEAVATGMGKGDRDARAQRATLLPPAPRDTAVRVASEVLLAHPSPMRVALRAHPPAARRRRHTRAFAALTVAVGSPLLLGAGTDEEMPLVVAALIGIVGAPIGLWFARDAYRSLGHALTARHLVVRGGSLRRGTVALERGGVIGWTITRSPLQRRAGLATVTATTAAGRGAYALHDVDAQEGVAFAEQVVPGLLAPLRERE
jgi:putative membrane protein